MMKERTYAIVGDSKGIGAALREQLLASGHRVIGVSRTGVHRPDDAHSSLYQSLVFDAVQHPCDLSSFATELAGLAYCPGTLRLKPLRGLKREHFVEDWEVNFLGAVQTLQANQKLLAQASQSSVVLFSTVAVQTGMSFHASIAGAKGAVEGLTRSLASEWAPNIRVNAIAPSLTDTPLAAGMLGTDAKREAAAERSPLKRIASAEEVAGLAHWLLSDQAQQMTGQVLQMDGGMGAIR